MSESSTAGEDGKRRAGATSRWRLLKDRGARWVVIGGGVAIIASILGIVLFIVGETRHFLHHAELTVGREYSLGSTGIQALGVNEHRSHLVFVDGAAQFRAVELPDYQGSKAPERQGNRLHQVLEQSLVADGVGSHRVHHRPRSSLIGVETSDGRFVEARYDFEISYEGTGDDLVRLVEPTVIIGEPVAIVEGRAEPVDIGTCHADPEEGTSLFVGQLADRSLVTLSVTQEVDFLGNVNRSEERSQVAFDRKLTNLVLDRDRRNLFGATDDGNLVWWKVNGVELEEADRKCLPDGRRVATLELLIGERSLVVTDDQGGIQVWFVVLGHDDSRYLVHSKTMEPHDQAVHTIVPGRRDRTFVALDSGSGMAMHFSTSEECRWRGEAPASEIAAAVFAPKGDGLYVAASDGRVHEVLVDNPHPEVTAGTLFGEVWYEGYAEPRYMWQSTGGTEEEEPKLSLIPLLHGTFKGTVFALLISIPLAILGAVYTSQFLHPTLRRIVKPSVEIMASLPSVVLGFLAGLWLAPRIGSYFPGLVLAFILVPIALVIAGALWQKIPRETRARLRPGSEILFFMVVSTIAGGAAFLLSDFIEGIMFAGDYRDWLSRLFDLTYDQRNAIVVGIAMAVAVIPIIYSISEDSLSNVPNSLISASLAVGASRWETVVRVVLPTASPGIFSAVMIGFGRAVGETMIVLMGSGNTPVMDWSPFNGLRTLSANIAVEIPEAPQGATLYRTLFLAALLLFALTFILNTVADLVSQRLRKRYASL